MDRKSNKQNHSDDEFAQTVMRWTPDQINGGPIETLPELERCYLGMNDLSVHHSTFQKLILEEARAAIAQGYDVQECIENSMTLIRVKAPKNPRHPWTFVFRGDFKVEKKDALIMKSVIKFENSSIKNKASQKFLGYASQDFDNTNTINVLAYISKNFFLGEDPKGGEVWSAVLLASILSQERMYQACQALSKGTPCALARTISTAGLGGYPKVSSDPFDDLNRSQSCAVRTFMHPQAKLMLLQGPPGTGKTTTIATILKELARAANRTLVCAPSNKAVEVLAAKFLKDQPERCMLLVGADGKVKDHLASISLAEIVKIIDMHLNRAAAELESVFRLVEAPPSGEKLLKLRAHHASVLASLGAVLAPLRKFRLVDEHDTILGAYKSVSSGKVEEWTICELDPLLQLPSLFRSLGVSELDMINNAEVLFCTLCVSGRGQMLKMNPPDALVVDEAGQSVEAETLIALQHNPSKMLLVGDTKQLPATVISTFAKEKHYDWSMMERLVDQCRVPALMLDEQYRMHPAISTWPSTRYYASKLRDGANIPSRARPAACPEWLRPLAFYDMPRKKNKEVKVGTSTANQKEAVYIARTLQKLREVDKGSTVGIIAPYSAQVQFIEKELKMRRVNILNTRVSTVDSFQGDECDYIFLSFVRSGNSVGFAGDSQRLNVAVTRAKHALLMVGCAPTLKSSPEFSSVFKHLNVSGSFHTQADLEQILSSTVQTAGANNTHGGQGSGKAKNTRVASPAVSAQVSSVPVNLTFLGVRPSTKKPINGRKTESIQPSSARSNTRTAAPSLARASAPSAPSPSALHHRPAPPAPPAHRAQTGNQRSVAYRAEDPSVRVASHPVPRLPVGKTGTPTSIPRSGAATSAAPPPRAHGGALTRCWARLCRLFGFRVHTYQTV